MAARRRGRKKTRRRKKQGVSVIDMTQTYLMLNVATQTLFKTNPYTFIVGDHEQVPWVASGTSRISLKELFKTNQHSSGDSTYDTMEVIKRNFNAGWFTGAVQMVTIPIAFKFGKNLARPAISRTNRLLNKSGVGSTIKL